MKAKINNTEIYFDIAGMQLAPVGDGFEERPVLFMLHGGPGGDHLRFKQHSLELQDVAQLVFIDHRGCGRSKKSTADEYSLKNNIEDIEALRKYLGLAKISILGTSYGGMVAQGYAVKYGKFLDKLILVATSASHTFIDEAKAYLLKHGNQKQIKAAERLWQGKLRSHHDVIEFFKTMDSLYSLNTKTKKRLKYSKSQTIWNHEALNQGFAHFLRKFDYRTQLKKIHCPTLILAGEKDWICRPSQAKILVNEIPKAKLVIFKKSSHAIAVDAHNQYIKIIQQFLKPKKKSTSRTRRKGRRVMGRRK